MQEIEQVFVSVLIRVVTLCQHFTEIIISDDLVSLSETAVFSLEATELPWSGVRGWFRPVQGSKHFFFFSMM